MKKVVSLAAGLLLILASILTGCTPSTTGTAPSASAASPSAQSPSAAAEASPSAGSEKQDFIADRTIVIKFFMPGQQIYEKYKETYAYKKIKELTGVSYEVELSLTDDSTQELTMALAAGDLPDVIGTYCEGTVSKGDNVVLNTLAKAGKDGMFADIKPYLADTVKFKLFLDKQWLTKDADQNIVNRADFDGHVYLWQTCLPRAGVPNALWVGGTGLYIRKDVVAALGVDVSKVQTQEDLRELAEKIKAGNFKDGNGAPCPAPIGPWIWGGYDSNVYHPEYDFGNTTSFEKDTDGQVKHVMMTDYPQKIVDYIRGMLADGLIAKETFTMPGPQATEAFANATYPIMAMHAFSQQWDGGCEVLREQHPDMMYVPIGPMLNHLGSAEKLIVRRGSNVFAISAQAKNPGEIIKWMDWVNSRFQELRLDVGVEGVNYTLVEPATRSYIGVTTPDPWDDGKVAMTTKEWAAKVTADPELAKTIPAHWIGNLNFDGYKSGTDSSLPTELDTSPIRKWSDNSYNLLKLAAPQVRIVDGFSVNGALSNFAGIDKLQPVLDAYGDTIVKAYHAGSDDEAKGILAAYKKQLEDAGLADACKYLQDIETKDPGSLIFYLTEN